MSAYDTMPGIYLAAAVVSFVGVFLAGLVMSVDAKRNYRLLWLVLMGLPLSPIANLLIKQPLVQWISTAFNVKSLYGAPLVYLLLILFTAPIVEELLKLSPLGAKPIRLLTQGGSLLFLCGVLTGIGFGLGENWYLAYLVAQNDPMTAMMPFYQLSGFMVERVISLMAHGAFSALAFIGILANRTRMCLFISAAIVLHALSNVPSLLFQMGTLSDQAASNWMLIIAVLVVALYFGIKRSVRAC